MFFVPFVPKSSFSGIKYNRKGNYFGGRKYTWYKTRSLRKSGHRYRMNKQMRNSKRRNAI